MAANGISTLEFKRDRQDAKLAAAAAKRQTDGNALYILDATQLPTRYGVGSNNANDIVDNENPGGLIAGRPWAVTALFVSLAAEFEITVDDTAGINPGMIVTGTGFTSETVTVVTVNSSTLLTLSIIAPDPVPDPGTLIIFTTP